jgi:hypothetical protein
MDCGVGNHRFFFDLCRIPQQSGIRKIVKTKAHPTQGLPPGHYAGQALAIIQ